MATPNGSRKGTLPQRSSELTISELDNESTPLLSDNSKDNKTSGEADPTTLYVQIINTHLPWNKRPSVFWLLPIFGLAWISSGMLFSSQGQFQASLLCREYLNRHTSNTTLLASEGIVSVAMRPAAGCQIPEIQAFTARFMGLTEILNGIGATFSIGYYSSLSDRHGRKVIMILAFIATLLHLCAFVAMDMFWDQIGLPLMIIDGFVNGLLGTGNLLQTIALAYTADCTDPANRSAAFSWVHAALFVGLGVGPYLGGSIVRATGTVLMLLYTDMIITTTCLFLTVLLIPESLPAKQSDHVKRLYETFKKRTSSAEDTTTTLQERVAWHSHVLHSLSFFKPNGRNTNLILLAAISFLQMLAFRGTLSVVILYTNRLFNWTEYEDGILFSLSSLTRLATILVLLPILVKLYKRVCVKKQSKAQAKAAMEVHRHGKQLDPVESVQPLGGSTPRSRQTSVDSVTTLSFNQTAVSPESAASKVNQATLTPTTATAMRTREQMFSDIKFDTWMIRLGFVINSITYVGYGLAREGWEFMLASTLHAVSILSSPSIRALLTNLVEPSQFGAALGALQVVDSVAFIVSPVAISWVYAFTVKAMPQFVWYSLAFWTGLGAVFSFMIRQKQFRDNVV
ncbi:hypothetical protein BGZ65_007342 [Modicella reniformis]|uniref:Major facilitator superfamily (MFS) profile domain-containing protein n=1 Tax=Modicella reniformis TaxID=1440133 RepID=A0A9P6J5E7_9FUNG|nr:hypothetical protein BGZ65_007342 [Modicella reniformis]